MKVVVVAQIWVTAPTLIIKITGRVNHRTSSSSLLRLCLCLEAVFSHNMFCCYCLGYKISRLYIYYF